MSEPNQYLLAFHHLGLAVSNQSEALRFLKGLGYTVGDEIFDPEQKVNLVMCNSETMPDVEVVSPSGLLGPLDNILTQQKELVYHCCFITSNLEASLMNIERDRNRLICVSTPKPAILFAGKPVSFYLVKGFGLIEIIEDKSGIP